MMRLLISLLIFPGFSFSVYGVDWSVVNPTDLHSYSGRSTLRTYSSNVSNLSPDIASMGALVPSEIDDYVPFFPVVRLPSRPSGCVNGYRYCYLFLGSGRLESFPGLDYDIPVDYALYAVLYFNGTTNSLVSNEYISCYYSLSGDLFDSSRWGNGTAADFLDSDGNYISIVDGKKYHSDISLDTSYLPVVKYGYNISDNIFGILHIPNDISYPTSTSVYLNYPWLATSYFPVWHWFGYQQMRLHHSFFGGCHSVSSSCDYFTITSNNRPLFSPPSDAVLSSTQLGGFNYISSPSSFTGALYPIGCGNFGKRGLLGYAPRDGVLSYADQYPSYAQNYHVDTGCLYLVYLNYTSFNPGPVFTYYVVPGGMSSLVPEDDNSDYPISNCFDSTVDTYSWSHLVDCWIDRFKDRIPGLGGMSSVPVSVGDSRFSLGSLPSLGVDGDGASIDFSLFDVGVVGGILLFASCGVAVYIVFRGGDTGDE
jgi:hypothetical protein